MKTIYVLHEFGCPSHVDALCYLASKKHIKVRFCEFNLIEQLRKRPFSFRRFLHNIFYLFYLTFAYPHKIILGIAPVNHALKLLLKLYNQHELFYHTSYTSWDFTKLAHQPKCAQDFTTWTYFITKKAKHIFAVTKKTKKELLSNFDISASKITVVNHSHKKVITSNSAIPPQNTYIYVGELSNRKGISELLKYFSANANLSLSLIGDGEKANEVRNYSKKYNNIHYKGYISDWSILENCYKKNQFLILNSHKTKQWEELFGMVLTEGMACGCIPLATNHSGPKEIITDGYNGFLCKEGEIGKVIEKTKKLEQEAVISMRKHAVKKGMQYSVQYISLLWEPVFK